MSRVTKPREGVLVIGRFELHTTQRLLLRDGVACHVGGRAFDMLELLVRNHDRVVGHEELLDCVWPGMAIEPNNVPVQIWALRKLLGPDAIVTVPRRGYRYVGPPPNARAAASARPARASAAAQAGVETSRGRLRWRSRSP